MAEVTDADWNKAIDILDGEGLMPMNTGTIGSIAAALAEERAKARAPFLRIADEWESRAACNPGWYSEHYRSIAANVRSAAEENR